MLMLPRTSLELNYQFMRKKATYENYDTYESYDSLTPLSSVGFHDEFGDITS